MIQDITLLTSGRKKLGDYQVQVIAKKEAQQTDTFSWEAEAMESSYGYVPISRVENVPLSEIAAQSYSFVSKQRESAHIIYSGAVSGQYSESISLSAVLTDSSGKPLSGKKVVFNIGGQWVTAVTDSNGVATTPLFLEQSPGKYYSVFAKFAGDEDYLSACESIAFEILN